MNVFVLRCEVLPRKLSTRKTIYNHVNGSFFCIFRFILALSEVKGLDYCVLFFCHVEVLVDGSPFGFSIVSRG